MQYSTAFCSRLEAANDAASVKFRDRGLNSSRKIRFKPSEMDVRLKFGYSMSNRFLVTRVAHFVMDDERRQTMEVLT